MSAETLAIVLGTRPEIIKMAPLTWEARKRGLDFFILHTGQHYSPNMDQVFFDELGLPPPRYDLAVGSGHHGEQTARMLAGIEGVLEQERPGLVLIEGDTNSILAAALAAVKLHIPVGHVEAGLRSYDRSMPEEVNRVVADHLSQLLFAPTPTAKSNLLREGIAPEGVFVTGNTVVDVVHHFTQASGAPTAPRRGDYFLATIHREENVDRQERLGGILEGLGQVCQEFQLPMVFPVHPRTQKRLRQSDLPLPPGIELVEAPGYREFLRLESQARLVFTDSGGVQEEACILGIPCITLRDNTERPETLEVGANVLTGCRPEAILQAARRMMEVCPRGWQQPFGDGRAGERIIQIIQELSRA